MARRETRTFRVPKRVAQQAQFALRDLRESGAGMAQARGVQVAHVLTANVPVDPTVAAEIAEFFTRDWRFHPDKLRTAGLYGGEAGMHWAQRCAQASGLVAAAEADRDEDVADLFEFSDEEIQAILDFARNLPADMDAQDAPDAEGVSDAADDVEDAVADAATEFATEAMTPEEEEDFERRLAEDALAEALETGVELTAPDLAAQADGARSRMAQAAMARTRREAIARMAQIRRAGEAAVESGAPVEDDSMDEDGGVGPKGEPHHSQNQPRDSHGRFATVGARVQDAEGNRGFVTGVEGDQIKVLDDDGNEGLIDPKSIKVVTAEGRARLPEPPTLVDDPQSRVEAYLAWAREQMGLTAAGQAPPTETVGDEPSPLFLSVVDEVDPSAVVALLALLPTDDGTGIRAFERRDGAWIEAPAYVRDIMGITPPPLVELDRETLLSVIDEMDKWDLSKQQKAGS